MVIGVLCTHNHYFSLLILQRYSPSSPIFDSPHIMGILNATPDSFSDGGLYVSVPKAVEHIGKMVQDGASIIDVGGESTRPGSGYITQEEELNRVIPVLREAIPKFPDTIFSVDTTKYEVARQALDIGARWINDVSSLQREPRFADLCAEYDAAYILMHSKGDPKTMQQNPEYDDVLEEVYSFFEEKIAILKAKGVDKIILDPGIGFGKTLEHNLKLLANLDKFTKIGLPVLVGASRKSMIGTILNNRPVSDRLSGTLAVHYHALLGGASILRVHDVKETNDTIHIFNAIQSQL